MSRTVHEFTVSRIDGSRVSMSEYRGSVLLIVNTASQCGFTPQYEGLEALYRDYADQGLVVLGFPCDQFGHQEPGSDEDIAQFCTLNFSVSFPMFSKIKVNGEDAEPLYSHLKSAAPGILGSESIKWNFTKFLIGRDGDVLARHAPRTRPDALRGEIEQALARND